MVDYSIFSQYNTKCLQGGVNTTHNITAGKGKYNIPVGRDIQQTQTGESLQYYPIVV